MRKTICDKCNKEIKDNEEYISIMSFLEEINEAREATELGKKEINVFHKKCVDNKLIPKK